MKIVKGMRDLLGEEMQKFSYLEQKAREVFALYGFAEIRTPLLEQTELFAKGVGEETDIVGKEMYLLEDRNGLSLALRPEGTASVVRAVTTNQLMKQNKQLRYYYMGPMFRYERPQKGRYRQFHQIGVELFGVEGPEADLEMFLMLRQYFEAIKLEGVAFQINSIGCQDESCRPTFKTKLVEFFKSKEADLCEDCQRRLETNPLRILDCKVPSCKVIADGAPQSAQNLCGSCSDHFNLLKELLAQEGIEYELNPKLVRGLDYYAKTVFEVYSSNLGAQSAAGGGGRFDGLFELYGEKPVPAVGFALGLDRIALLSEPTPKETSGAFVVGFDNKAVLSLTSKIRQAGTLCHYDPDFSSMKSQFKQAGKQDVKWVLILGEDEIKEGKVGVKNMTDSTQESLPLAEAVAKITGN